MDYIKGSGTGRRRIKQGRRHGRRHGRRQGNSKDQGQVSKVKAIKEISNQKLFNS